MIILIWQRKNRAIVESHITGLIIHDAERHKKKKQKTNINSDQGQQGWMAGNGGLQSPPVRHLSFLASQRKNLGLVTLHSIWNASFSFRGDPCITVPFIRRPHFSFYPNFKTFGSPSNPFHLQLLSWLSPSQIRSWCSSLSNSYCSAIFCHRMI